MARTLKGWILRIAGWGLVVIGLMVFVLPIPMGLPMVATGLVILVTTSRTARRMMRWLRMRSRHADNGFTYMETRVPARLGAVLRKTRFRRIGRKVGQKVVGVAPVANTAEPEI